MAVLTFLQDHTLLALVLAALVVFIAVHIVWYIHPSDIDSADELETSLRGGQPTVVEFYSNL